jgi:hypothetical protein
MFSSTFLSFSLLRGGVQCFPLLIGSILITCRFLPPMQEEMAELGEHL